VKRLVSALLLVFALAGCGVPLDSAPRAIDGPQANNSGDQVPDDTGSATVRLYLVRDGRLVRVIRRVSSARSPNGQLLDLLRGPTSAESADGLTSALTTMDVISMTVTNRRATVNIGDRTDQGARSDEVLAYGQIVCTLTSQGADIGTVSFMSGGMPLAVPRADGSLADSGLTIADYAGLLDS
jgi:predicted small lipoprotein YifL